MDEYRYFLRNTPPTHAEIADPKQINAFSSSTGCLICDARSVRWEPLKGSKHPTRYRMVNVDGSAHRCNLDALDFSGDEIVEY